MTFVLIEPDGAVVPLNGATPVTVVAAPAAGVIRTVISVRLHNADTAVVTVTLNRDGGTPRSIAKTTALAADADWQPVNKDAVVIIDDTTSLKMVMSGAPATTNPNVDVAWIDRVPN